MALAAVERAIQRARHGIERLSSREDDAVILRDGNGIILAANQAAIRMYQVPGCSLIGAAPCSAGMRHFYPGGQIVNPYTAPSMMALRAGMQYSVAMRLQYPDRDEAWACFEATPIHDWGVLLRSHYITQPA